MTDFKDPDFSSVDALPDPDKGVKLSTELDQLAKGIRTTAATIDTNTSGRTPESVVNAAGEAAKGAQDMATNAAIAEEAIRILKDAKAEWEKATIGAKAADLRKAEDAVTEAKTKLAEAQKAEDTARDAVNTAQAAIDAAEKNSDAWYDAMRVWLDAKATLDAAVTATKAAEKTLQDRRKEFNDMKDKRYAADQAYERARTRACEKMAEIKGEKTQTGDGGRETPGTSVYKPSDTGTGTGTTSGSGSGGKSPGGKSPGSTPSTPSNPSGTPGPKSTDTGSGKTGSTPDAASLAAAQALLNGQGQQNQQGQQAQGTPAAATQPQQAQQPQQEKKDEKKDGKQALDENDITRLINGEDPEKVLGGGSGVPLGVGPVVNATGPSSPPQSAPSGQHGTSFRTGAQIPGVSAGGVPNAPAAPPTTGHSVTGMNTQTDTSGRSAPTAGAFDSPKTNTSAAHGTATGAASQAATQQAGKGAMPMMPMMPPMGGMGGHAAGGSPRSSGDKDSKVLSTNGGLDHGQTAVSEAVRGGTIAQNRPDAPDPR